MKRTINYTGRKRIAGKHFSIDLNRDKNSVKSFTANIDLNDLNLPAEAAVYVEAYHLSDYQRYRFGTVSNPTALDETDLSKLGYPENLTFRIIVVDETGIRGRILAHAAGIRPTKIGDKLYRKESILPVDFRDIGHQSWTMRYESSGEPVLVINENLRNTAKADSRFFVYVYPAALREALLHMIFITKIDVSEPEEWQGNWLTFARQYVADMPDPFNPDDEGFEDVEVLEWVDRVVEGFCNSRNREWNKFIEIEEAA